MSTSLQKLFARQKGRCHYCDIAMVMPRSRAKNSALHMATKDHCDPQWSGGSNFRNTVAACRKCNNAKGPLDEATFRAVRHDAKLLKEAVRAVGARAESEAKSRWMTLADRLDQEASCESPPETG